MCQQLTAGRYNVLPYMMTQFCCGNVYYIINTSNRNHRSESALLLFFIVFKIRICREQIQQNRAKQTHVLFLSQDWMTLRFMTQNNEKDSLPRSQSIRVVYLGGTEEAYVTWDQYPNSNWYVRTYASTDVVILAKYSR